MRIKIDFAEMQQYIDDINQDNIENIMVDKIQDYYFQGADAAVIYIGRDNDFEYFEFDLIPC